MPDEIKPKAASEDPKSIQNGLGLDALLDGPLTKPKPSSKTDKVEEKVDAKVKGSEPKSEVKEVVKTEAVDMATIQKQLKDTRDYATKVNKDFKELQRSHTSLLAEVQEQKARLDGTYVEKQAIPPEQKEAADKFVARVEVDNQVMIDQYGADVIQKLIWDTDGPYQQLEIMDPALKMRVTNAKRPIAEAMKIVEEHQFFEKYGRDPSKIKEAIIAEERDVLVAEIRKELKGKPIESVNSLSGVNTASREEQRKVVQQSAVPDLDKVFPVFHKQPA